MKFHAKVKIRPNCSTCEKPIKGTIWMWLDKAYCGNCVVGGDKDEPGWNAYLARVVAQVGSE